MANRIKDLNMSVQDVIMELSREEGSEGYNPGALRVLMQLFTETPRVDPDNALEGLGSLLALDTHRIYGSHIWIVFKDICGGSIETMIGLLRAIQLGFYSVRNLQSDVSRVESCQPVKLNEENLNKLLVQVREQLPNFGG